MSLATAMVCCILMQGCQPSASDSSTSENGLSQVTLQLNWLADAQHGGFYAAAEAGHFAAEGLEVEITPGGPGSAVLPKVAMGRCDFAIANADQVLLARAQNADVVAVFAAMQDSPRCIMVHEASGIENFDQLSDVTLALGDGKAFAEYLKKNAPLKDVRFVSYSGSVAKFLVDQDFAQQGYVFSEPVMAKRKGGDPRSLMVSELGFNPYSSLVVTRRELYEEQPELVRKFVRAVRNGWRSYLEDPDSTNKRIIAANSEMTEEILAASALAIQPLCDPDGTGELGVMQEARWKTLRSQLVDLNLLPEDAAPASQAFVAVE